ncbi:TIGR01777 family oxidoreductase [Paenibacillus tarimensis]|uniref:TIGR01777 family oxidoreductase n=1 Tax=Paenibacillus tarimensis TaxID=416012 RepID=UPI001F29679C|nr:TIGR01777 family oxidoreductase [Paenibacillus tarimensis]MCF2943552.1 TIGR01777 family oxidoreductase [Paenibacillus tarimensis]
MRVAVTGGTGFIGSRLVDKLLDRGDDVWIVTRSAGHVKKRHPKLGVLTWDQVNAGTHGLGQLDALVNLAGESINQRWTDSAKQRIMQSRLKAAAGLERLAESLERRPAVVVNASGISYYGTSETETFTESSPQRITDFLAEVVDEWEKAADRIPTERLVKLRVGIVLAAKGGAFPLMALPYRLFGGGRVGSGRQWISWIHIEDMLRLILFCVDQNISGPVNAVAPDPVTNDRFGRAIGRAMKRPHWFPVPAALMRALFGELSVLLLEGQKCLPQTALDAGFAYRYPTIDQAMQDLVGK